MNYKQELNLLCGLESVTSQEIIRYKCQTPVVGARDRAPDRASAEENRVAQSNGSGGYQAGVKKYAETYWTPDYVPLDTDLLAVFKVVPQEGVPPQEAAAAVAASLLIFVGMRALPHV